jgi:hypothetical protein
MLVCHQTSHIHSAVDGDQALASLWAVIGDAYDYGDNDVPHLLYVLQTENSLLPLVLQTLEAAYFMRDYATRYDICMLQPLEDCTQS